MPFNPYALRPSGFGRPKYMNYTFFECTLYVGLNPTIIVANNSFYNRSQ